MANCDFKIITNIAESCDNPMVQGMKQIGYLGNFEDLDKAETVKTGNKITSLALKGTAKLIKIYQSGKEPFTGSTKELAAGTFRNNWNKNFHFIVFESGADTSSKIIDKLANGKFFAIVENNYLGASGDNAFEIIGYEQGATASAITQDKNSDDTNGGWDCTLVEEIAPSSGIFICYTDVAATRSALEALVVTAGA